MGAIESMVLCSTDFQPAIYLRYIDEIFGIWMHGPEKLDKFLECLNNFHPSLKFSIERTDHSSKKQIHFLDILIKLEDNGFLTTELYMKPMAFPIVLPFSSAHPIQTKRSVLYAQLLRAKRLGISIPAQNRGMNQIESLFRSNGYPNKMIRKAKFFAITSDSRKSSRGQKRSNNSSDTTYISLPFIDDSLSNKIQSVVKKPKLPVRIAWQSGSTLSEKLTSSALIKPPCPAGNKKMSFLYVRAGR